MGGFYHFPGVRFETWRSRYVLCPYFLTPGPRAGGQLVRHCFYRERLIFVMWFLGYAFGSHAAEWLALGAMIVIAFALRIASLKFIVWLLTRKRDKTSRKASVGERLEENKRVTYRSACLSCPSTSPSRRHLPCDRPDRCPLRIF
jgi:hypothetical protein